MREEDGFGAWITGKIGARSDGQVAAYVGVSPSTVGRWRHGGSVQRHNVPRLAEYLGVSEDEIERRLGPGKRPSPLAQEIAAEVVRLLREEPGLAELRSQMVGLPADVQRRALEAVLEVRRDYEREHGPRRKRPAAG